MKPMWTDYKYGSWLVLVFGQIDAKIVVRDGQQLELARKFGVILHPEQTFEYEGSAWEAKGAAECALRDSLIKGLAGLEGATAARMGSTV